MKKNKWLLISLIAVIVILVFVGNSFSVNPTGEDISSRFKTLNGYSRIKYPYGSYENFVQNLKLKKDKSKIYLYNGKLKVNQSNHVAIIDYDVGEKDLQQCADAIMRIRAEYFYESKQYDKIKFHLTNGFLYEYSKYLDGYRLKVNGNETTISKNAGYDISYKAFRKYLDEVFMYAGTLSLKKESKSLEMNKIKPGSFFVDDKHAAIVVDVIENKNTKDRAFLVAQSYMSAQSIHILKNPNSISAWYSVKKMKNGINTPEWKFKTSDLMEN